MKESINNKLNDILHNDIITKTKSGIYDLVSGVRNLFRHNSGSHEENDIKSMRSVNNYLKSPEEIEAEFRALSSGHEDDNIPAPLQMPSKGYTTIITKTDLHSGSMIFEQEFPDFMEENY
jgi:hypothetical protein